VGFQDDGFELEVSSGLAWQAAVLSVRIRTSSSSIKPLMAAYLYGSALAYSSVYCCTTSAEGMCSEAEVEDDPLAAVGPLSSVLAFLLALSAPGDLALVVLGILSVYARCLVIKVGSRGKMDRERGGESKILIPS
jgi:hypothetical protein